VETRQALTGECTCSNPCSIAHGVSLRVSGRVSPTASRTMHGGGSGREATDAKKDGADVAGAALAHTVETLQDPGLHAEYEQAQTKKLTQRAQAVAHDFVYTEVRASRPLSLPCAAWGVAWYIHTPSWIYGRCSETRTE